MALVFIPVLGSLVGARDASRPEQVQRIIAAERGDFAQVDGFTARYIRLLRRLIAHPGQTVAVAVLLMVAVYVAYAQYGRGVEFFPHVEPRFAQVQVQARGDLSVWEADRLVRAVEARLLQVPEIRTVYARTIGVPRERLMSDYAEDVIGIIQLELLDWRVRLPAAEILDGCARIPRIFRGSCSSSANRKAGRRWASPSSGGFRPGHPGTRRRDRASAWPDGPYRRFRGRGGRPVTARRGTARGGESP
jgi:multidrug efflux pump subunit AcrB